MSNDVCEFCEVPEVVAQHKAEPIVIVFLTLPRLQLNEYTAPTTWPACSTCHKFIKGHNWEALEKRCADAVHVTAHETIGRCVLPSALVMGKTLVRAFHEASTGEYLEINRG